MRLLSPIDASLVEYNNDYLLVATNLEIIITGDNKTGYWAKVRGMIWEEINSQINAPATVTIAYYPLDYCKKAEATERARDVMRIVKYFRQPSI